MNQTSEDAPPDNNDLPSVADPSFSRRTRIYHCLQQLLWFRVLCAVGSSSGSHSCDSFCSPVVVFCEHNCIQPAQVSFTEWEQTTKHWSNVKKTHVGHFFLHHSRPVEDCSEGRYKQTGKVSTFLQVGTSHHFTQAKLNNWRGWFHASDSHGRFFRFVSQNDLFIAVGLLRVFLEI